MSKIYKVFINGVNVTKYVNIEDFQLVRYSTVQHTLSFSMISTLQFDAYNEVKVTEDSLVIYGGIIQNIEPELLTYDEQGKALIKNKIWCVGYKIRTQSRTVTCDIQNMYAGDIITEYIVPSLADEGITQGAIEKGVLFDNFKVDIDNVSEVLKKLADNSGFSWWIDTNKRLNFAKSPKFTYLAKEIDFTYGRPQSDAYFKNGDFRNIKVKQDLSEYRNKQFAVGKDSEGNAVFASWQNTDEIIALAQRYGSGVFGNVVENEYLRTEEECRKFAENKMFAYGGFPVELSFDTNLSEFNILQLVYVKIPQLGIKKRSLFFVNKIEYKFGADGLTKGVTLSKVIEEDKPTTQTYDATDVNVVEVMPRYETPEQKMARLKGKQSSTTGVTGGGSTYSPIVTYWKNPELLNFNTPKWSKTLTHEQQVGSKGLQYGVNFQYTSPTTGSFVVKLSVSTGGQELQTNTMTHTINDNTGFVHFENRLFGAIDGTYRVTFEFEKIDSDIIVDISQFQMYAESKERVFFDSTASGNGESDSSNRGQILIRDDYRIL